jgi:hypothetical protein
MDDDEYTPRERGLLIGAIWAEHTAKSSARYTDRDGHPVDVVAEAAKKPPQIPDDVRRMIMDEAGMRERLDASEDPDADGAFWAGFRDGVRAYIVLVRVGAASN